MNVLTINSEIGCNTGRFMGLIIHLADDVSVTKYEMNFKAYIIVVQYQSNKVIE